MNKVLRAEGDRYVQCEDAPHTPAQVMPAGGRGARCMRGGGRRLLMSGKAVGRFRGQTSHRGLPWPEPALHETPGGHGVPSLNPEPVAPGEEIDFSSEQ